MNYYQAREIKPENGGGWHFTVMNDGRVWRHQCCQNCEPPHATKEEAEECYAKYLLDNLHLDRKMSGRQGQCVECEAWTQGFAEDDGGGMIILCDEHRTREIYKKHWTPPTQVISSW